MTSLDHPRLSGLGRNPTAPQDVLIRLATHKAGRNGISLRRVVEFDQRSQDGQGVLGFVRARRAA